MNLMDTLRRIIEDPYVAIHGQNGYVDIVAEGDSSLFSPAYANFVGYATQPKKYQGDQYPALVTWFSFCGSDNSKKLISQLFVLGILYRMKRNYSASDSKFKYGEIIDAITDMAIKTNTRLESLSKQLGCEFVPLKVNICTYGCMFDSDFASYMSMKYLPFNCISFENLWPDRDIAIAFKPLDKSTRYSAMNLYLNTLESNNSYLSATEYNIGHICELRGYNFDRVLSIAKILSVD